MQHGFYKCLWVTKVQPYIESSAPKHNLSSKSNKFLLETEGEFKYYVERSQKCFLCIARPSFGVIARFWTCYSLFQFFSEMTTQDAVGMQIKHGLVP